MTAGARSRDPLALLQLAVTAEHFQSVSCLWPHSLQAEFHSRRAFCRRDAFGAPHFPAVASIRGCPASGHGLALHGFADQALGLSRIDCFDIRIYLS